MRFFTFCEKNKNKLGQIIEYTKPNREMKGDEIERVEETLQPFLQLTNAKITETNLTNV